MSEAQQPDKNLLLVEEERVGTSDMGYPLMEGERYGKSPLSDQWYRLTRWEDRGEDRLCAVEKQEVSLSEVEEAIER